ncbi:hypothetical protein [Nesterenkonia sp.]|uniref:hypothetical protein n=1 Tax=Nesterenkonia sp. TaxID=704201 RepID=UPI002620F6CC|nr:hypothetical protein [Nesterenkonia sp.]
MTEDEVRIEYARLLESAVEWTRRANAEPGNGFLRRQRELAVERAERYGAEVLRAVVS